MTAVCVSRGVLSALEVIVHGVSMPAVSVGHLADGRWHFLCVSWRPNQAEVRVSLDGRTSCAAGDAGVSQQGQDSALVQ